MAGSDTKRLSQFKGLNNVDDPMRGPLRDAYGHRDSWEWQSTADNVDITNSSSVKLRDGYQLFAAMTNVTGSYSTVDNTRLFVISNGALTQIQQDGSMQILAANLSGKAYWAEVNNVVYLSCGADKYQIDIAGGTMLWGIPVPSDPMVRVASGRLYAGVVQVCLTYTDADGREGGAHPAVAVDVTGDGGYTVTAIPQLAGYVVQLYATEPDGAVFYKVASLPTQTEYTVTTQQYGAELTTQFLDVPPVEGAQIAVLGANIYMAEYIAEANMTVVWVSQSMGYHLFNLNSDYLIVPGEVTQMYGANTGLVIATSTRIYVYDNDKIQQVAEYGAVHGQHADLGTDEKIYFWTKRGLCRVMPFENLTEAHVSMAPGIYAGGGVVDMGGYKKYIAVIHQGGDAYNRRTT